MAQQKDAFNDAELTILSIEILKDLSITAHVDPEDSFVYKFECDHDNKSDPDDENHEVVTQSSHSTLSRLSPNVEERKHVQVDNHYAFNEDNISFNETDFIIGSPSFHLPSYHRNTSYTKSKPSTKPKQSRHRPHSSATIHINRNSLSSIHRIATIPDFEPRKRRKHRHKHKKPRDKKNHKHLSKGIILPMSISTSISANNMSHKHEDEEPQKVVMQTRARSRTADRTIFKETNSFLYKKKKEKKRAKSRTTHPRPRRRSRDEYNNSGARSHHRKHRKAHYHDIEHTNHHKVNSNPFTR